MGHGMHPGIMLICALMHRGLVGKEEMGLALSAQPYMEMGRGPSVHKHSAGVGAVRVKMQVLVRCE